MRRSVSRRNKSARRQTLHLEQRVRAHVAAHADAPGVGGLLVAPLKLAGFPVWVLHDAVLEPVDKVVWMVLRRNGVKGRFPSHAQIARIANIASATSVARSIEILRAERWLTLCERINRGKHPTGTTVHALHDKPLPVPDTLHMDPAYFPFLLHCEANEHPRVRRVARDVLQSLNDGVGHTRSGPISGYRLPP